MVHRTYDHHAYSPLDHINRENVGDLRLAWMRAMDNEGPQQLRPLVHDGVMYIAHPGSDRLQALGATTGDLIWDYRRELPTDHRNMLIAHDVRSMGPVSLAAFAGSHSARVPSNPLDAPPPGRDRGDDSIPLEPVGIWRPSVARQRSLMRLRWPDLIAPVIESGKSTRFPSNVVGR